MQVASKVKKLKKKKIKTPKSKNTYLFPKKKGLFDIRADDQLFIQSIS